MDFFFSLYDARIKQKHSDVFIHDLLKADRKLWNPILCLFSRYGTARRDAVVGKAVNYIE